MILISSSSAQFYEICLSLSAIFFMSDLLRIFSNLQILLLLLLLGLRHRQPLQSLHPPHHRRLLQSHRLLPLLRLLQIKGERENFKETYLTCLSFATEFSVFYELIISGSCFEMESNVTYLTQISHELHWKYSQVV